MYSQRCTQLNTVVIIIWRSNLYLNALSNGLYISPYGPCCAPAGDVETSEFSRSSDRREPKPGDVGQRPGNRPDDDF